MDNFDRLVARIAQMLSYEMSISDIFWQLIDDLEPNEAGAEFFYFTTASAKLVLAWDGEVSLRTEPPKEISGEFNAR